MQLSPYQSFPHGKRMKIFYEEKEEKFVLTGAFKSLFKVFQEPSLN